MGVSGMPMMKRVPRNEKLALLVGDVKARARKIYGL
jgi:hypothetical protein